MVETPAAFANCTALLKRSAAASLQHPEASVCGSCVDRRFMAFKSLGKCMHAVLQTNEGDRRSNQARIDGLLRLSEQLGIRPGD